MSEMINLERDLKEASLSLENALQQCESLIHDLREGRAGPPEAAAAIAIAQAKIKVLHIELAAIREALHARVEHEQAVQAEIASRFP